VTKAVVLKPDFVEGYQILAAACVEKGDNEQAKKYAALMDLFAPDSGRAPGAVQ
jgi:hypothetical protein